MSGLCVVEMGDACLSVVFDEKIDPSINRRCVALAESLEHQRLRGVRDVVPTYHTVAVYFDPRQIDRELLRASLVALGSADAGTADTERAPVDIPVTYGGPDGPDLAAVAAFAKCSEDEVVRMHSGVAYRVYMLGFLPGFAYLGSLDRRMAMPRLESPRMRVPAGSVGIAGVQTAIYPCDTPGGWRIIGRTAARLFDPSSTEPFLLKAGDRVKFVAV